MSWTHGCNKCPPLNFSYRPPRDMHALKRSFIGMSDISDDNLNLIHILGQCYCRLLLAHTPRTIPITGHELSQLRSGVLEGHSWAPTRTTHACRQMDMQPVADNRCVLRRDTIMYTNNTRIILKLCPSSNLGFQQWEVALRTHVPSSDEGSDNMRGCHATPNSYFETAMNILDCHVSNCFSHPVVKMIILLCRVTKTRHRWSIWWYRTDLQLVAWPRVHLVRNEQSYHIIVTSSVWT